MLYSEYNQIIYASSTRAGTTLAVAPSSAATRLLATRLSPTHCIRINTATPAR